LETIICTIRTPLRYGVHQEGAQGRIGRLQTLPEGSQEGAHIMDPWDIFSEMCRQVVDNQNCYLDVLIGKGMIELQLMPLGEEDDYEEEDEE